MRTMLCLLSFATLILPSWAQDVVIPDMPYEQYHAMSKSDENQAKEYPALNYWGIQGFRWGEKRNEVMNSQSALLRGRKKAQNALSTTIQGRRSDLPSDTEFAFAPTSQTLTAVRHHFAMNIKDRKARLDIYRKLKAELEQVYKAPTDNFHAEETFRGEDAYVQGLDKGYHVEWRGPETIVSLRLSDKDLILEFRQAQGSQAGQLQENAQRGHEHRALIQEQLKKLRSSAPYGINATPSPK